MKKRVFSLALALIMALGVLPAGALAVEEEDAYVQTISLPVVEDGEEMPAPQGLGISTFGLQANEEKCTYMYAGMTEVNISYVPILDPQTGEYLWESAGQQPASNGLVQVVDENGQILASTMHSDSYYTRWVSEKRDSYYATSYTEMTGLSELEEGVYALQLAAGSITYPLEGSLVVVGEDCLFIDSAYAENFSAGCTEFDVRVNLYGFETEEELDELSFTMKDGNGTVVASSTGAVRDLNAYQEGNTTRWYTYLQMKVAQDVAITNSSYYLEIAYSGEKLLVDGVGGVSAYPSNRRGNIADFGVVDGQKGIVRVEIANWDTAKSYKVEVREGHNGTIYGSWEGKIPEDGIVPVQLMLSGMETSLNNYGYNFYVFLYMEGNQNSVANKNFNNPYYNIQQEYVYFNPYYIPASAKTVDFHIQIGNGCSYYKGKDDVLVLRDTNGKEVARCEDMTIGRVDETNCIVGTLTLDGSFSGNKRYYAYLNEVQFDDTRISDQLNVTNYTPVMTWSGNTPGTMWTNFGVMPVMVKAINSSGKAQIVLREKDTGKQVLTSGVLTGTDCELQYHKQYQYFFTPEELSVLESGTAYMFYLKDQNGDECRLYSSEGLTYITAKTELNPANNNHLYVRWHDINAGSTEIKAQFYINTNSTAFRNVPLEDIALLKNFRLVSRSDASEYTVTAVSGGTWSDTFYQYEVSMTLDRPIPAGQYDAYYGDKSVQTYISIAETTKTPRVWANNATSGMISGEYLSEESVYTCKLFDGYTCLTPEYVPMTLSGANNGETQYLIFGKEMFADLEEGTYEMRVYQDGKVLGTVEVKVVLPAKPVMSIQDEDENWNDDGDTVIHDRTIDVSFTSVGAYQYIRLAESKEALAEEPFETYRSGYWYGLTYEGEDGPRKLYVELSMSGKDGDENNILYENDLYLCLSGDYGLEVPEDIQGIKKVENWSDTYTITATTAVSPARVCVRFYDAAGNYARQMMNFVRRDADGTAHYELTFRPNADDVYDNNYTSPDGYQWFEYADTVMVEFVVTDMSQDEWVDGSYIGFPMGGSIKRVLLFGDPTGVILPQFINGPAYTNSSDFVLYGYATPNATVTVNAHIELASATTDEYGYFTTTVSGLEEGTHYLGVSDGIINDALTNIIVDKTAPAIDEASFTFLEGGNAVLSWVCSAADVDHFEIYKNDKRFGTAKAGSTSYNVVASLEDGNTYYVKAVDYAGNVGELALTTEDTEAPAAVTGFETGLVTSATATLKWKVPYDNAGVQRYEIWRDGVKVGESAVASFTDSGLSALTTYSYTVYAIDGAGNKSEASVAFSVTTTDAPPEGSAVDTNGNTVNWKFDPATGTLTLSGSGVFQRSYQYSGDVWTEYVDLVNTIVLEEGITGIVSFWDGPCDYPELTKIQLSSTVASIENGVFVDLENRLDIAVDENSTHFTLINNILYTADKTAMVYVTSDNTDDTVTVLEGVTTIQTHALHGSYADTLHLPASLTYLSGMKAPRLEAYTVASGSKHLTAVDGVLYNKAMTELLAYPARKDAETFSVPAGVKELVHGSFQDTYTLRELIVPEGLESIGNYAFLGSHVRKVLLPDSVSEIGSNAFNGSRLESVRLPKGMTSIPYGLFRNCSYLTSVIIPESVTNIEGWVFANSGLRGIYFCGNAPALADYALRDTTATLYYMEGKTGWTTPKWNGLNTALWAGPPEGECGEDLKWAIVDGVLTISGTGAMYDYDQEMNPAPWTGYAADVTEVVVESGVTTIGMSAFSGLENVETVTIPEGVTSIGSFAFVDCNITEITLPASLEDFGYMPFGRCENLEAVHVAEGNAYLESVDGVLFNKNAPVKALLVYPMGRSDTSYTVPAGVEMIGERAFVDNHWLEEVILPKSLKGIGAQAFENTDITSIEIPRGVTEIGDEAFVYCTELTDVIFKGNAPALGTGVFADCPQNLTIHYTSNKTGFDDPVWGGFETNVTEPEGASVSTGKITSYKPGKTTFVQLVENDAVVYEETLSGTGDGQTSLSTSLDSVEEGTYDLVIKKDGCLDYVVKNVVVDGDDLDLSEDGKVYADIELVAGDIDDDNKINLSDLAQFRTDFGKQAEDIENDNCDVDGDGKVNLSDLAIFRQNFGKTTQNNCTVDF